MESESAADTLPHPALLGLRRALLDWRDYWIEETHVALDREAKALWVDLDDIDAALSPLDRLFHNNSVELCERRLTRWIETTQGRLPDAALADLAALIRQSSPEARADRGDMSDRRLALDTLPAVARLRGAAKASGAKRRAIVTGALTGEGDTLAAGIEDWLRRTAAAALTAGGR